MKLIEIVTTLQERWDVSKHKVFKNKKKYSRKNKHNNNGSYTSRDTNCINN
jgi:hypothetical protein